MLTGFILDKNSPQLASDQRILISLRSASDPTYTIAITPNGVINDYSIDDFVDRVVNNVPKKEFEIGIHRAVFHSNHKFIFELPWGQKLVIGDLPKGVFFEITVLRATGNTYQEKNHVFIILKDGNAYAYNFNQISDVLGLTDNKSLFDDFKISSSEIARVLTQKFDSLRQNHAAESISNSFQNTLYVLSLFLFLVMFTPLGFVHPTKPAPENNNIILVWQGTKVSPGDEVAVIYRESNQDIETYIGQVQDQSSSTVVITTDQNFLEADNRQLLGKVLLRIPFIGKLLN